MKTRQNYLFAEYTPVGEITQEVKQKNQKRTFTGGIRIGRGLYRTTKDELERRNRIANTKLP